MTFSIVARDPERGHLGVAVSTAVPCVGAAVPHVRAGVGAIATQAFTNIGLGVEGLRLLELGLSPEAALTALLDKDAEPQRRQVAGVDSQGRVFAYTGEDCVAWCGSRVGDGYSVQGNMLVGEETIAAMAEAFEAATGYLTERLLTALEAGQAAGGDRRGRESAALVTAPFGPDPYSAVDIRVDQHEQPVAELRRIMDSLAGRYKEAAAEAQRLETGG